LQEYVGVEFLTAVVKKNMIFWVMLAYGSVAVHKCFVGTEE
jgi:hypothetical protein